MKLTANDWVIDFETQSRCDLLKYGSYRYAEDASTNVICCSVKQGDSHPDERPLLYWGNTPHSHVRHTLQEHLDRGGRVWAWNSMFEWAIATRTLDLDARLDQFRCIMSLALMHGLPGALDKATKIAGTKYRKSTEGKGLINKLCVPNKKLGGRLATPADFPDDFEAFGEYCRSDTMAEFEMLRRLPDLLPEEWATFDLDREINERGVYVDLEATRDMLGVVTEALGPLNREVIDLTNGEITNVATQHQRVLKWLQARGFKYDTTRKEILLRIIAKHRSSLAPEVVKLIDLRLQAARSSTSKLEAVLGGVMQDGRVRGTLKHSGAARTQRWSAQRPLQVHNFPRPHDKFTPADQDQVIGFCKLDPRDAHDAIDLIYGKPIHAVASSLRGIIIAPEGKIFRAGDFAAIEARGAAWLTGEEWLLQAFQEGRDVYKEMASVIFNTPIENIDSRQRFVGKQTVLGCGYGMGEDKFMLTCVMLDPNTDVTQDLAGLAVSAYRDKNKNIVAGWYSLQRASVRAIHNPGEPQRACRVTYVYTKSGVLKCILPSGRAIYYWDARVEEDGRNGVMSYQRDPEENSDLTEDEAALEDEDNMQGRRVMWGGALLENITQAMCRDLLRDAMLRMVGHGAPIVMHAHDEAVLEVAPNGAFTRQFVDREMSIVPAWAAGMPIKVETWEGRRFRK